MTTTAVPTPLAANVNDADRARMAQLRTRAVGLDRMLLVATALIELGREVDLAALEPGIALLCADMLDLPPDLGREFCPTLIALSLRVDATVGTLRLRRAASG